MEEITSLHNSLVKETSKLQQKKYRDLQDKFLLEGYKSIYEAFNAGIEIEYIFVEKEKQEKYSFFAGNIILTNEGVLKKISTTESAPEAVGVARQKHFSASDFCGAGKVVLLENIKDLGNLGTILRTCAAFGVDGVLLYGECADLYNPKCVRSSVGNLWKIPVAEVKNLDIIKNNFSDYQRVATLPLADNGLKNFTPKDKILIMFGSEADGLTPELVEFSNASVKIEMHGGVESLNLSVACGVVLYSVLQA